MPATIKQPDHESPFEIGIFDDRSELFAYFATLVNDNRRFAVYPVVEHEDMGNGFAKAYVSWRVEAES